MTVNSNSNSPKYTFTQRECLFLACFPPQQIEGYPTTPHIQISDLISYAKSDLGIMNQSVLNHFSAHDDDDKIKGIKKYCATFLCPDKEINKVLDRPLMEQLHLHHILKNAYFKIPAPNENNSSANASQLLKSIFFPYHFNGNRPEEDLFLKITMVLDLCFLGPSESKIKLLNDVQASTQRAREQISGAYSGEAERSF